MSAVSGIARMNLAAADDESLTVLRAFFARAAENGTDGERATARDYLAVIDEEISLRTREPT